MKGLYFKEIPLIIFPFKSSFPILQKKTLKIILHIERKRTICADLGEG